MSRQFKDITGQTFGLLVALRRTDNFYFVNNARTKRERRWVLRCACGEEVIRSTQNLKKSKTCGSDNCRNPWISKVFLEKRGLTEKPLTSWQRMTAELKVLRIENAKLKLQLGKLC